MTADGSWKLFVAYKAHAKANGLPKPRPGSWGPEDASRFERELSPDSIQTPGQQGSNANTGKNDEKSYTVIKIKDNGPKYIKTGAPRSHASSMDAIAWVAENMSEEAVETAPSAEAYNMLEWVRSSAVSKREFWLKTYPKLIPDKIEAPGSTSTADDSGYRLCKIEELLSKLEETDIVFPEGSVE